MYWKNLMIWRKKLKITIINKEFDILISKKEFTEAIYKRLEKALDYIKNNSIDSLMVVFI